MKYGKVDKLFCIDPYLPYDDGLGGLGEFDPQTWNYLHIKVAERLVGKAELIRCTSLEGGTKFTDLSLDFVYLDGDHSAVNVKKDIDTWFPKVKPGGIIGGHDAIEAGVMQGIAEWIYENKDYAGDNRFAAIDWWIVKHD
jgi:predicted O-methyltransferase YrrM